jgi:hypothetical protein
LIGTWAGSIVWLLRQFCHKMGVQVSPLWGAWFFCCIPRSGMAGPCGRSGFNYLRNLHTDLIVASLIFLPSIVYKCSFSLTSLHTCWPTLRSHSLKAQSQLFHQVESMVRNMH